MRFSLSAGRISVWFLCDAIAARGLRAAQLFYGLADADPLRTLRLAYPDEYGSLGLGLFAREDDGS